MWTLIHSTPFVLPFFQNYERVCHFFSLELSHTLPTHTGISSDLVVLAVSAVVFKIKVTLRTGVLA